MKSSQGQTRAAKTQSKTRRAAGTPGAGANPAAKHIGATVSRNLPKRVAESSANPILNLRMVTSTVAQNEFRQVLDDASRDQIVVITRHAQPQAVLLSYEKYCELSKAESTILDTLTGDFDAMLDRMQTPEVRSGTQRGFGATPHDMGKAAESAGGIAAGRHVKPA